VDVERLMHLPIFGELDHHDLSRIANRVNELEIPDGTLLIEQGTLPYDVFVLEEGTVEVTRDGESVATLGAGEVVGEIALLNPQRRTASVRATSRVRAVVLRTDDLDVIAEEMPEVMRQLRAIAERRLRELEARG
jgi:CRP/FNR family transcriptional regulator, cyclic AMP receptor protein